MFNPALPLGLHRCRMSSYAAISHQPQHLGWSLCLSAATPASIEAFRTAVSADTCAKGDPRSFIAAMSHSNQKFEKSGPNCPPSNNTGDNGCAGEGWGCEPICCGGGCVVPSCPNELWPHETRIHIDMASGCCGKVSAQEVSGVLCCKDGSDRNGQAATEAGAHNGLGRTLSAINMTSYGWVYTW
eukprot:m.353718 g.353718  ORF g.353718 m.353718 type:complete len:185 (-) comp20717_c0_seq15:284-838(-)